MTNTRDSFDRLATALTGGIHRHPWLVLCLVLAVTVAAGSGVRHLKISNNYRVFFSADNAELVAFDNFQETYTKNDNVLFILRPKGGDLTEPVFLDAVESLTAEAWQIPYAIRVDSITNFQHSWADGDDLTVEDLIQGAAAQPRSTLEEKIRIALEEPLLNGNLIASDARATGINVTLQYPEESLNEVPEVAAFARKLAADVMAEHPEIEVALSGVSMLNNAFAESGIQDGMTLVPFMYLALIALTWAILRSAPAAMATLLVIGLSTVTAMGLGGYLGITLAPISVTAPTIILTLAIADSVHILISILTLMRGGADKLTAIKESLRMNIQAVVITSVTTIVGFLSLNYSDAPPFRDLGNLTALGITAALFYSITFLPAFLFVVRFRVNRNVQVSQERTWMARALSRLAEFVIPRHRLILVGSALMTVILTMAVPTLDLNDDWVEYFDHRVDFRNEAEFGIEHLSGIYPIEFSIG